MYADDLVESFVKHRLLFFGLHTVAVQNTSGIHHQANR